MFDVFWWQLHGNKNDWYIICRLIHCNHVGADPGFGVWEDGIRQGDLRVIVVSDVYGTYDAGKLR